MVEETIVASMTSSILLYTVRDLKDDVVAAVRAPSSSHLALSTYCLTLPSSSPDLPSSIHPPPLAAPHLQPHTWRCISKQPFWSESFPIDTFCQSLIVVPPPEQSRNGELLGKEVVRLSDAKTGTALANIYKGK